MLRTNRILRGLVMVGVFWSIAMVVFETFQPIRLAELLGSEDRAGAVMGPVASLGWAVFAMGSALAGVSSARIGIARTAILARILNSAGAIVMGLVAGPAALVAAYLVTYGLHGTGGPMHSALLHREARARNRATVLSMNSMMMFAAYSIAARCWVSWPTAPPTRCPWSPRARSASSGRSATCRPGATSGQQASPPSSP